MNPGESSPPSALHRLPDGRSLEWCEYGDASGSPVFWFHGLLSSRLEVLPIADALASSPLRVIVLNRPGIGRSSGHPPQWTPFDWAHDVANLADALSIGRFGVIAYSGASIFALASKATLAERISRLNIVSGSAPRAMPRRHRGSAPSMIALDYLAGWLPTAARWLVGQSLDVARKDPDRFAERLMRDFRSRADREILSSPLRASVINAFVEAGRQGPQGIVEDIAAVTRSELRSIDNVTGDVHLWHGDDDRTVPIAQARWMTTHIPSARLTVWPTGGHLHSHEEWLDVCRSAIA